MDVVPVMPEEWKHPPFGAEVHDGKIYARGAQDMKCIGIQYLEAIRRLKENNVQLQRTIHCSFVPDEEIGGAVGMKQFVKSKTFKELNIGMALDEGLPSVDDRFLVYYGERCMWHVTFHCPGQPGHGSLLLKDTAAEKLHNLMSKIMQHRAEQVRLLDSDPDLTIGDVMTVNVTILNGGQQANVLPSELTMTMDCRIPVTSDIDEWSKTLDTWCAESGEGIYMVQSRFENAKPTDISDENPYWMRFKESVDDMGLQIETRIFPGGTDSRFLREMGIPALGFSPIINHPVLLHDTDEYLAESMFLRGIEIYMKLISSLGDIANDEN
ncbi:aminoacylase-1A-like [Atheta coriaria]|uniref:aminoacylase-1A-like n=1 Tax=Dalotia coriaria TaxID=877792 RepID=UPI0031F44F8C